MNISNNIIVNSETTSFKSLVSKNNQYISLNKDKNELVFSNLSNNNKFDQTENEIINEIFENILKNLTENFLNRPNSKKEILLLEYEHELDCYKLVYQKIFGMKGGIALNKKIKRIFNDFLVKFDLNYLKNDNEINKYENKISLKELHIFINLNLNLVPDGKLPADLKENLKINSEYELIQPISLKEEAFIRKYLESSPEIVKQKAHYELIKVNVEKFINSLRSDSDKNKFLTVNNEKFRFYNIDYSNYKFMGSAVDASEIANEYKGFQTGKWPYLCTSIIDETQTFFFEGKHKVFQVFTPSYESIVHTSHIDIKSPYSGRPEQEGWYSMNKKGKILSAYIFDLYKQFNELYQINTLGNSTSIDEYMRLKHLCNDWLTPLNYANQNKPSKRIRDVMSLLSDSASRQDFTNNHTIINKLSSLKFLDKDIQAIKELVDALHFLEKKYPEFTYKNATFDTFNRLSEVLNIMIEHYDFKQMNEYEKIEEYIQLFNTTDPNGHFEIINELNSLKELISFFKPIGPNNSFNPYLDRIQGPQEILSQSYKMFNNEINFDTYSKEKIKIKAWVISKSLIDDKENNQDILNKIFSIAKQENIPVLVRKPLPNFLETEKRKRKF